MVEPFFFKIKGIEERKVPVGYYYIFPERTETVLGLQRNVSDEESTARAENNRWEINAVQQTG